MKVVVTALPLFIGRKIIYAQIVPLSIHYSKEIRFKAITVFRVLSQIVVKNVGLPIDSSLFHQRKKRKCKKIRNYDIRVYRINNIFRAIQQSIYKYNISVLE